MDINLSNCFIAVDDFDKALVFYRDVLGLEVRNDVAYEGMRWVTVGSPSQPDVNIVLEPPVADPGAAPADREAAAVRPRAHFPNEGRVHLRIGRRSRRDEDVDAKRPAGSRASP